MLHLNIDPHSGIPVYRQVMDQIQYYCAAGTLSPGDKLPSVRELARELHVHPATIVKAYSELEHAKVIVNRQGKGAFIADSPPHFSAKEKKAALQRLTKQLVVEAVQMGASADEVLTIVKEEIKSITKEKPND